MFKRLIALIIVFFSFSFQLALHAQEKNPVNTSLIKNINKKSADELLRAARKHLSSLDFKTARECYQELIKRDSTSLRYNFEMGLSYYDSPNEQLRGIPYFETVVRHLNKDTLVEVFYYLGRTLHLANRFDEAISSFEKYITIAEKRNVRFRENDDEGRSFIVEAERWIEMCNNAKALIKVPTTKIEMNGRLKDYEIVNLKENINSTFDDYSPVLSPDDSTLYYVSRRKKTSGSAVDPEEEGKFYEDIYVSKLNVNGWQPSALVDKPVNTGGNDAPNFMGKDGKTLYFTRGEGRGTFYSSAYENGKWLEPVPFDKSGRINTEFWETSFYQNTNSEVIYFTSERPGGVGGRDIYRSFKQSDGTWGKQENLGTAINTEYDEDAPYITPDGKTLFFASKGHNSMGGFDVFKSTYENGKWSTPLNLGYPINTSGNDIYFIMNHDADQAFYSSARADAEVDGNDMDIFSIDLCDENPVSTIKGLLISKDGPVNDVFITITDKETNKKIARTQVDKNGRYTLSLLRNKTNIVTFEGKGMIYFSQEIFLPKQCKLFDFFQQVEITRKLDLNASQWIQHVLFKNAFFDIKKRANAAGFNSPDEVENYAKFISALDKSKTRFNYNELTLSTCISDVYDTEKLKLNFYTTDGSLAESAPYNKGIFAFRKIKINEPGVFKLAQQDPEQEYTVNVAINNDTLQLEQTTNGFSFPNLQLARYNKNNELIETVPINHHHQFVFHTIANDEKNIFRISNNDKKNIYAVRYPLADGSMKQMQYQDGTIFPEMHLHYFSSNAALIETTTLDKSGTFTFANVDNYEEGVFQLKETTDQETIYHIRLTKGGLTTQRLNYQDGKIFPQRTLHFFRLTGAYVASAVGNVNNVFKFRDLSSDEPGFYKLEGDNIDEIFLATINLEGKLFQVVRNGDGFTRTDKITNTELKNILNRDTAIVFGDKKANAIKYNAAYAAIIDKNYQSYQAQLKTRPADANIPDTSLAFPPRKLLCYNNFGEIVASAPLTTGNSFNFNNVPAGAFYSFRIEGEEGVPDMAYGINFFENGTLQKSTNFNELVYENGYSHEPKRMQFFNKKGELQEVVVINKNGEFVFTKLQADEKGLFKMEGEESELAVYSIKIGQGNKTKHWCYQNGTTYPKKVLRFYDTEGNVVASTLFNKNGQFSFSRLPLEEQGLFQLEADDDAGIETLTFYVEGKPYEAIRSNAGFHRVEQLNTIPLDFLPGEDLTKFHQLSSTLSTTTINESSKRTTLLREAITLINKNDKIKNTVIYAYDRNGTIIDYAKPSKGGIFKFTKIPSAEYGLFKINDEDPSLSKDYSIVVGDGSGYTKTHKIGEMQTENGYFFPSKKMSFYDEKGQLVETSTMNKNGVFEFAKLKPDDKGNFKADDNTGDPSIYEIQFRKDKNNSLQFQQGVTYAKKSLLRYDESGQLMETALMDKNGVFIFRQTPVEETNVFKLAGNTSSSPVNVKFQIGNVPYHAVKTQNGYMRVDGINASQLEALSSTDSLSFSNLKQQLKTTGDSTQKNIITAQLASFIEKNYINHQTKLEVYNSKGEQIETASLVKGKHFVLANAKPGEFTTYKITNGTPDKNIDYEISTVTGSNQRQSIHTNELRVADGYLVPNRKLSFTDESGKVVETATVNKKGEYVFTRITADTKGSFQPESSFANDHTIYTVKTGKGSNTRTMSFQAGSVFAARTLTVYNSNGKVLETSQQSNDGTFAFNKQHENGIFKIEGNDTENINVLKLNMRGTPLYAIKTGAGFVRSDQLSQLSSSAIPKEDLSQFNALRKELNQTSNPQKQENLLRDLAALMSKSPAIATAGIVNPDQSPGVNTLPSGTPSLTDILFDFNSAEIKDEFKPTLNNLATYLVASKDVILNVSGHTDAKGNENYNLLLSKRRVNAVVAYLKGKGVRNKQISTKIFGKSQPVAPNENPDGSDNPEGRKRNRRVELKIN